MMNTIKILIAILAGTLLLPGCTRDDAETARRPVEEGEKVTVALEVQIPKAGSPVIVPVAGSKSAKQFIVSSEASPETRSDGTTKLYNLWLFQFHADGRINGVPHKVSDTITVVNDMVLLDVPLVVSKDQTLYLVALGRQLEADLNYISSFSEVEALSFPYTIAKEGLTRSKITSDNDIPFAGYIKGATVVSVDTGENRGQIEYNTPDGFAGGISIRRLMSRITLKYKFEAPGYKLDGLRLTNVNSTIRITNPATNDDTDTYITIDGENTKTPDGDGFYSVTWFVAQNQQGTVDAIATENDRYCYFEKGTGNKEVKVGAAPAKATNIEAWAYSTTNTDSYAIYQIYVGKNNTSNFDVTANTQYNLRTTINTDIESAKNDKRVRAASALQNIYLYASGHSNNSGNKPQTTGDGYDFDAHYDKRLLTINTKGRIATVGIYTDAACTQLADSKTSWLKISSSGNYTDAYHNTIEPLGTYIKTDLIQLPTQLVFYLYNDEYFPKDDQAPEATEKRRLYIKVGTTTEGIAEGGAIERNSIIYYFDQRPAISMGRLGGEFKDGEYPKDLYMEEINEYKTTYLKDGPNNVSYLYMGYAFTYIDRDNRYDGVLNSKNGRLATIQMTENPGDMQVNKTNTGTENFPNPIKQNGHVMLYQYTIYNVYAARYCYDKNRDENGNGYLDDSEIKWYMPSIHQLYGFSATAPKINISLMTASFTMNSTPLVTLASGSHGYIQASSFNDVRCVREGTPKPGTPSQARFYIHTDGSTKYGAVDASNMPNAEDRSKNPNFYVQVPLCEYSETGNESIYKRDSEGNIIYVKRVRRHENYNSDRPTLNSTVSSRFLISPTCIDMDGNPITPPTTVAGIGPWHVTWANAMGYLASANTTGPGIEQYAVEKGCALYRGKNGTDALGSWRMPTQREMLLVGMFIDSFNNAAAETGSVVFNKGMANSAMCPNESYWTATENKQGNNNLSAWRLKPFNAGISYGAMDSGSYGGNKYSDPRLVRCIRDISPTN